MRKIIHILFIGMLFASTAAMAQQQHNAHESYRYSWIDDSGQPHYSDSLTDEAIKNGYDVLNSSGLVVRHVQRQLSPKERKEAEAAAAKNDAAHAAQQRRISEDQQMLAAYPNVRAFRDAQQAQIDQINQTLQTTQINLHAQEQNLADLLAHVADLKHSGESVPKFLRDRIDKQRASVTEQRATLARQRLDKAEAEKQMDARIKRYRKLRAASEDETNNSGD
jgi:valyl-tRNA synthetase